MSYSSGNSAVGSEQSCFYYPAAKEMRDCLAPYLTHLLAKPKFDPSTFEVRTPGQKSKLIKFNDAGKFFLTFANALPLFNNGLTIHVPERPEQWCFKESTADASAVPAEFQPCKYWPDLEYKISLQGETAIKTLLGLLLSVSEEFSFALTTGKSVSYVRPPWKHEYVAFYNMVMWLAGGPFTKEREAAESALGLFEKDLKFPVS